MNPCPSCAKEATPLLLLVCYVMEYQNDALRRWVTTNCLKADARGQRNAVSSRHTESASTRLWLNFAKVRILL